MNAFKIFFKSNLVISYTAMLIQVVLFSVIITILYSDYLWFDESGQFYLSQGFGLYPNNSDFQGTIIDSIYLSNMYNLDPPGFTLLLKFWSKISTHILWLRLLPLLFYICFYISFGYIIYLLSEKYRLSILSGLIVLFFPPLISKSIELRAYSMEALATTFSIMVLIFLVKNITNKKLFIFSIISSFFITSRYSFLLLSFIHTLIIFKLIVIDSASKKKKFVQIIIYSSPLILTVILIFIISASEQLNNAFKSVNTYLPSLSTNPMIIFEFKNLIYILIIFSIIIFYYHNKNKIKNEFKIILEYTIISNLFFFTLSFLNLHPWSIYSPARANVILIPSLISINGIIIHIYGERIEKFINYISISLLIIISGLYIYILDIKMEGNWRSINIISDLKNIELDETIVLNGDKKIIVDHSLYTSLKHLMQFGRFKTGYKYNLDNFIYEKLAKRSGIDESQLYLSIKNLKKLEGYNFLSYYKKD